MTEIFEIDRSFEIFRRLKIYFDQTLGLKIVHLVMSYVSFIGYFTPQEFGSQPLKTIFGKKLRKKYFVNQDSMDFLIQLLRKYF